MELKEEKRNIKLSVFQGFKFGFGFGAGLFVWGLLLTIVSLFLFQALLG